MPQPEQAVCRQIEQQTGRRLSLLAGSQVLEQRLRAWGGHHRDPRLDRPSATTLCWAYRMGLFISSLQASFPFGGLQSGYRKQVRHRPLSKMQALQTNRPARPGCSSRRNASWHCLVVFRGLSAASAVAVIDADTPGSAPALAAQGGDSQPGDVPSRTSQDRDRGAMWNCGSIVIIIETKIID